MNRKRNILWVMMFLGLLKAVAQKEDLVVIHEIKTEGLKKTHPLSIIREITIHKNDTITLGQLPEKLNESKVRLLRTGIFEKVDINLKDWQTDNHTATLLVTVKEAYQTIFYPYFELADRNFNVWWVEQNHDFKRISIGGTAYFLNLTGNMDRMRILAQGGFTNKVYLEYIYPALNERRTLGLRTKGMFSSTKEVWYKTQSDKLLKKQFDKSAFTQAFFFTGLNWRPGIYTNHILDIGWQRNEINDSIAQFYNPEFLGKSNTLQNFGVLQYTLQFDKRNIRAFATKGYYLELSLKKEGLFQPNALVNTAFMTLDTRYFTTFSKKFTLGLHSKSKYSFIRNPPPYFNSRTLGYRPDYLRGYEYYVIEGIDFTYLKSSFFYKLLEKSWNLGKAMPIKSFRQLPFIIYPSLNFDVGYVNNPLKDPNNSMINRWLYSFGVGINILAYHTRLLQIEFSVNHLQEKGVFLHYDLDF